MYLLSIAALEKLYYRLGYKRVGELPDYVVDGHSELLLMKRLA